MKRRICFVLLAAVFALFMTGTSATADVSPWFVEEIENSEAVLAPGELLSLGTITLLRAPPLTAIRISWLRT